MAILMKYGDIKGNVTLAGFKDWIELDSFSKNVVRQMTVGSGGKQREGSHAEITDIAITKKTDASSAKLFQDSLSGKFDTKVEIKFTTTANNKIDTYLAYELTKCGVSSYSISSGGENPHESLTLNYLKIMMSPSPLDEKGSPKAGDKVTHDLSTAETS